MRILTAILGILMVIGGLYCIFAPGATYLSLGPVLAVFIIVEGIGKFVAWWKFRKADLPNPWLFVSAILSVVLGCAILGSVAMSLAFDLFIAFMVASWIVLSGIMNIAAALSIRKAIKAGTATGGSWIWTLIFGILMIAVGICGFFNPIYIALAIGLMLGVSIISSGVGLIALAFA